MSRGEGQGGFTTDSSDSLVSLKVVVGLYCSGKWMEDHLRCTPSHFFVEMGRLVPSTGVSGPPLGSGSGTVHRFVMQEEGFTRRSLLRTILSKFVLG